MALQVFRLPLLHQSPETALMFRLSQKQERTLVRPPNAAQCCQRRFLRRTSRMPFAFTLRALVQLLLRLLVRVLMRCLQRVIFHIIFVCLHLASNPRRPESLAKACNKRPRRCAKHCAYKHCHCRYSGGRTERHHRHLNGCTTCNKEVTVVRPDCFHRNYKKAGMMN